MTFFQVADVFTDGFESGDTSSWSATSPQRFGALAPALASTSHGIKTWTTPPPPVVTTVRLPRSE
jgi:hypothetical protein